MPKGGPLSFLNKKTWHPGNAQNQERLWKKEQEHAAELKRLEEFKKQIAEERQKKELEDIAVNAGVKVQQDRLDWMYQGSMMAKAEAQQRQEEAMLEGKPVQLDADGGPSKVESVALLPSFYSEDTPASANETWARLHSDPLFAIKQQEIAARKRIIANPVQMDVIKEKVKLSKEAKKEAKAAAKVAKKEAKKAAKNMEAEMTAARQGVALDRHQPTGRSMGADGSSHPYHPQQQNGHARGGHQRQTGSYPSRYDDEQPERHPRKRSMSPARDDEYPRHKRARSSGDRSGRPEHGYGRPHEGRSRGHHGEDRGGPHADECEDGHREDGHHRHGNGYGDGHRSSRAHHDDERYRDRRMDTADGDRSRQGDEAQQATENGRARRDNGDGAQRDGPPAGPVIPDGYGLKFGSNIPEGLESQDRRDRARETKERLEKAAKAKAEEEAAAAKMRHTKTEYKTGRLTEEERMKKLAEMTGNASVHEEARWQRLASARKKDDAEEASLAQRGRGDKPEDRHSSDTAKFIQRTGKGLAEGVASLEDRVGRAKFYQDRGSSDRNAFRR